MFPSTFDSFDASALGAYQESALHARGGGLPRGDVIVRHGGTSFDGVGGGSLHLYLTDTDTWVNANTNADSTLLDFVAVGQRLYGKCSTATRCQYWSPGTSAWVNQSAWSFSSNTLTAGTPSLITSWNGKLVLGTASSSATKFTVSGGGGSASIVEFDAAAGMWSTVADYPFVGNCGGLIGHRDYLVVKQSSGAVVDPYWTMLDGGSWVHSSIEHGSVSNQLPPSSNGSLVMVSRALPGGYGAALWDPETDSIAYVGGNGTNPAVPLTFGTTGHAGKFYCRGAGFAGNGNAGNVYLDGILRLDGSAWTQITPGYLPAFSSEYLEYVALGFRATQVLVGGKANQGFAAVPPYNFYELRALEWFEALGSSGVSAAGFAVNEIYHAGHGGALI